MKFCKPHSLDESYAKLVMCRAWFGVTRTVLKWVMVSPVGMTLLVPHPPDAGDSVQPGNN